MDKNQKMFNSDVELAKFLGGIDVIQEVYRALLETDASSTYERGKTRTGITVLAFNCSSDYTNRLRTGELDLVSLENQSVLKFISTKVNPKFSINKAAVELFEAHFEELSELLPEKDVNEDTLINGPLVITGRGLGGYLAIMFSLWYQHIVDVKESEGSKTAKRRPICITFGSPLLGDEALRHAISERPQWYSCFLNVVAKMDPFASFFSSNTLYKPFGTYLLCMESGRHTAFEDEVPILAVLKSMASSYVGDYQNHDYTNDLDLIRGKILKRAPSESGESNLNSNPLKAGIVLQFGEIGLLDDNLHALIAKTEDNRTKKIKTKRIVKAYDDAKKLNEMKISLTYMEWYMTGQRSKGGYYDSYKNALSKSEIESQHEIMKRQRFLNLYWKKYVEDKNLLPQKEGAKLRTRWLLGGNNYRWIVEPLDIAEYYKKGKTNYIENRANHYQLLEKWLEDEMKNQKPSDEKTKAASLTMDSCFWARVEDALILLRELQNGGSSSTTTPKSFEDYVWKAIQNFSLSPDVFLEGSSLMKWWIEYKDYMGSSHDSEFIRYMNDGKYLNYE